MLQRNLLYTAVTRAKKKVILVGTKAALQRAVRATDKSKRYTLLAQRLKEMKYAESWGKVFKNLLFPPACPGCGCYVSTEAEWCEVCRKNLLHPRFLDDSRRNRLDGCYALCDYSEPVQRALTHLKYKRKRQYGRAFLGICWKPFPSPGDWRCMMPLCLCRFTL